MSVQQIFCQPESHENSFQSYFLKTLTFDSMAADLLVTPASLPGICVGIEVTILIPEKGYKIFNPVSTIIACLILFYYKYLL